MRRSRITGMAAAAFGALIVSTAAVGQTTKYECTYGQVTYTSDRPCAETAKQKPVVVQQKIIGAPQAPKAPAYVRYQSQACAELHDAVRTAPSRGIRPPDVRRMRDEYWAKCADDDADARRKLAEERGKARDESREQVAQRNAENQRIVTTREQCDESLRILAARRKLLDTMTPGQRADHDRAEANYAGRCKS